MMPSLTIGFCQFLKALQRPLHPLCRHAVGNPGVARTAEAGSRDNQEIIVHLGPLTEGDVVIDDGPGENVEGSAGFDNRVTHGPETLGQNILFERNRDDGTLLTQSHIICRIRHASS